MTMLACSGAYYACGRVEFEVGSRLQVMGDRELAFFPGVAHGAAYPGTHMASELFKLMIKHKACCRVTVCGHDGHSFMTLEATPSVASPSIPCSRCHA